MLGRGRRRWASIEPTSGQHLVFAGNVVYFLGYTFLFMTFVASKTALDNECSFMVCEVSKTARDNEHSLNRAMLLPMCCCDPHVPV